jgi:hypothetical protein
VTAIGADDRRTLTPLEMAQNAAAAVFRYGERGVRDPLGSLAEKGGERAHAAAQLAGAMALVSIAEDLHYLVAIMTGRIDAEGDGMPDAATHSYPGDDDTPEDP